MSVTSQSDDAAHLPPRIRVVPLKELLDQANKPFELRQWILERAGRELCRVYVLLPPLWFAYPAQEGDVLTSLQASSEANLNASKKRAEIKFVRLAPRDAEQFGKRGRMDVYHFPDGLFVPNDVSADSGDLEATTFSGWFRVSSTLAGEPSHPDQNVQNCLTIMLNDLFVEDSVCNDVRSHFEDTPRTEPTPYERACGKKPTSRPSVAEPTAPTAQIADAIPAAVTTLPENTDVKADDPYGLKGRSDGVYMLYRTAERCALNPEFISASKAENEKEATAKAKERKEIALETFNKLLSEMAQASNEENQLQRKLQNLFRATRLDYALYLIDPHFKHNNGRAKSDWCDWPGAKGKAFLTAPDPLRKPFVTDMLRLIIGGAKQWLDLKTKPATKSNQGALQQWLEGHGLTGVWELTTAFVVITWNGQGIPTPPKFAKPSTSRGRSA